ncbi:short-chain dehydrogenase [Mycolicibacterium conceptionense]|uniref:Short-chain dehydrogenase n=1 Tax=Mycolicibacterium conceptionense TaxID=451644 RepID=A0A1A2VH06_9MYCO|nr:MULTISPECIES: SDR family NAD(P)-dependent oxidoreductase [Mycolicibacterium]MCW1820240.1 SDR family NAD(P)-dependent oxidoreductase [Mycolicibacterium senegalense]OBB07250.1 short-chain dehydrogenase [Mycolicibacterium conceptionense]OBF02764.1 short-chain dehydrogenase [Mycolicibacterium conceptionense]OBF23393.1 short-chain dehydrogenase [Mycolicibacterium conceptionense]OBF35310.1 short-chain dehydrogenase [Mycolicibacterium conceptionense]
MTKWTTAKIPDQSGRTAIVTGANTGLGLETAKALAAKGAHVVLAVRNLDKGAAAVEWISRSVRDADLELQRLDLGSLASVREAAAELRDKHARIDLLINNAGVMTPPRETTSDGFELQFGTNHLGHFALTGLLLDRLLPVVGSRIVTVSSIGHRFAPGIRFEDLQWERRYNRLQAYGQSKLANLLFTYELQRRLIGQHTTALAAHPGGSDTELARHLPGVVQRAVPLARPFFQEAAMGALPTLRAATDPGALGGQYYGPDGLGQQKGHPKVVTSNERSYDIELQRRLWAVSEELTGVTFPALESARA